MWLGKIWLLQNLKPLHSLSLLHSADPRAESRKSCFPGKTGLILVRAATTIYHRWSNLTNISFSYFWRLGVWDGSLPAQLCSGEKPLPAYAHLSSCCVLTEWRAKRKASSLLSLLIMALIPLWWPHPHGLIIYQRPQLQMPSQCRVGFNRCRLWGHRRSVHSRPYPGGQVQDPPHFPRRQGPASPATLGWGILAWTGTGSRAPCAKACSAALNRTLTSHSPFPPPGFSTFPPYQAQ